VSNISTMSRQTDVARSLRAERPLRRLAAEDLRRWRTARLEINPSRPDRAERFAHLKRSYD
jgi:hypothetical protein